MTSTPLIRSAETFDFVIVGAGSAGCVLANRLTEDPSTRVLLLEAGPHDALETIQVPALFSALFGTDVDWNYQIEKQAHYQGSTTFPRGKTLGGSSSINLMVYIRGTPRRLRRLERARQCRMGLRQRAAVLRQGRAQQSPRRPIPWHRRPTACRGSAVHPRAVARLGRRRLGMGLDPQRRLQWGTPDRCGRISGDLPQRPPLVWCRWVSAARDAAAQPRRTGGRPRDACAPRRQPGDRCLLRPGRHRDDRPRSIRGPAQRRRHQLPAAVAALGDRSRRSAARTRHRRRRRRAGGGREPARPHHGPARVGDSALHRPARDGQPREHGALAGRPRRPLRLQRR